MRVWKVLGVAGLAGVAATGVLVTRNERRRAQLTPEEIRDRLQERYAASSAAAEPSTARPVDAAASPPTRRVRRTTQVRDWWERVRARGPG